jgi:protein-S-isoprenylcysteine O-methyltransferase Ste14
MFALAAVVVAWSILVMRRAGTTIEPGGTPSAPVSNGPFCHSRNPMYLALLLALAAFAPLLDSRWLIATALLLLLLLDSLVIPREEQLLLKLFGAEVTAYCRRVRRWL